MANEWPGPPLRTAVRNGLLAGDAARGPVAADVADEAQTDPGLPRPRTADPAEAGPGEPQPEAGAGQRGGSATEPTAAGASGADPAEPAPAGETRRGRSKRAAAEPDGADEWISLLTADPVED